MKSKIWNNDRLVPAKIWILGQFFWQMTYLSNSIFCQTCIFNLTKMSRSEVIIKKQSKNRIGRDIVKTHLYAALFALGNWSLQSMKVWLQFHVAIWLKWFTHLIWNEKHFITYWILQQVCLQFLNYYNQLMHLY